MKFIILAYGSRGDIQPFLPLSVRLMDEGHSVKPAAPFRLKGRWKNTESVLYLLLVILRKGEVTR